MDSGGARPDPAPAASRLASWLRAAAWIGGGLSVVVGTVVLAGWVLGVRALESIAPGSTTMKPLTAEAFIAAGAALWVIQARDMRRGFRLVGLGLSLAVLVLGLVTLCEYAFGWNAGIDQALFRGAPGMASGGPRGGWPWGPRSASS